MRLQKFLAQTTSLSRRAAERAIAAGEVNVNGTLVTKMGVEVDPRHHKVFWRGKLLRPRSEQHADWVLLYKPKQVMVTKSDPQGRKTIWEIVPRKFSGLNAVGRLDYDSEGLLLLTGDGEAIHKLTHPSFHVEKVYLVKVQGQPDERALGRLLKGLNDLGEHLAATDVAIRDRTAQNTWLEMVLHSGKYRQIRRMCEQLGFPVLKLKRVRFGAISIGSLRAGAHRTLSPREVRQLLNPSAIETAASTARPTVITPRAPAARRRSTAQFKRTSPANRRKPRRKSV